MTTTAASKQALGAYGETVAARHLVDAGLVLLERNWRCDEGEIDLVLREGSVLVVCCEVSPQLRNRHPIWKRTLRHLSCESRIATVSTESPTMSEPGTR